MFTLRDVSLPEMPSDWFNKELNDQQPGRRRIGRTSGERERKSAG